MSTFEQELMEVANKSLKDLWLPVAKANSHEEMASIREGQKGNSSANLCSSIRKQYGELKCSECPMNDEEVLFGMCCVEYEEFNDTFRFNQFAKAKRWAWAIVEKLEYIADNANPDCIKAWMRAGYDPCESCEYEYSNFDEAMERALKGGADIGEISR